MREILTFSIKAAQIELSDFLTDKMSNMCFFPVFSSTLLSSYERLFIPPCGLFDTVIVKVNFILAF